MDKQQTMIIAAVAVVAIVAIAAIIIVNPFKSGGNGGDDDDDLRCLLRVYGNADMNNYLDDDDLSFIKEILDGKNAWDPVNYPLADADCDDAITQNDYNLVKKFLNGQSATMYYLDWDNEVAFVDYPLSKQLAGANGIAVSFTTGLDIFRILGHFDEVTMMTNSDIAVADIDPELYPGIEDVKAYSAPRMRHTADTYEMFVENNVKVFLSEKKFLDDTFLTAAAEDFDTHHLNVIKLPTNRYMNGICWEDTLVTLGVMMNAQDKTAPYIAYLEDALDSIADASKKANNKSCLIPYFADGYDLSPLYLDTHGTSGIYTADVYTTELIPLVSAIDLKTADGFGEADVEQIIAKNPDCLVVAAFGYATSKAWTEAAYKAQVSEMCAQFRALGYTKPIYVLPFESCVLAGPAFAKVVGSMIWSDAFSSKSAWNEFYDFFVEFMDYDGTLDDLKSSKFAPWQYSG
jgi:hypothetical protein